LRYVIRGVKHNIAFLRELCDHPKFIDGNITTKFIEEEYPDGFKKPDLNLEIRNLLLLSSSLLRLTEIKSNSFVITIDEKEDACCWTVNCKKVKDEIEIKLDDEIITGSFVFDLFFFINHIL
jgi:acetyl/propionyl-CoA carboxylase alpha subunit